MTGRWRRIFEAIRAAIAALMARRKVRRPMRLDLRNVPKVEIQPLGEPLEEDDDPDSPEDMIIEDLPGESDFLPGDPDR